VKDSKNHKPGSLHNQPERSSIANEFVYTCMRMHVRYYPMGGMWDKTFPVSSSYLVFQRQPLVLDFDNFGHQRMSSSGVWKCRVMPWWQGITARELKVKLKVWGLMLYCQGITQDNDQGSCFRCRVSRRALHSGILKNARSAGKTLHNATSNWGPMKL
jgi:hypothetical protein